ncbi:hypothetical protein BaRGS_00033476 [Batillaria attramentaria]|uniref:Monocarboxylate transporter n=1 Tax=Batillaria attramentaria TaxID=370345 RepID=A0ABD0JKK6_9CAEN
MKTERQSPWRWAILGASVMANMLTTYGTFNAGVLKVAVLRHYGSDDITTTWLMTYHFSLFALAAPLASAVINMVNCRACVVLSGILCLAGYTISAFITNFYLLFFSLTLVGVGRALGMIGSIIILAYYFPDRTNIVTGASLAGGGLGMFIHPPLFAFLDEVYGLPGAFLLSGAVAFHGTLCGCVMRPSSGSMRQWVNATVGPMRQWAIATVGHCDSGPMRQWANATVGQCDNGSMRQWANATVGHCDSGSLRQWANATMGQCDNGSMRQWVNATVGSVVSRLLGGVLAHDRRVGNLLLYCGLVGVEALATLVAPPLLASGQAGTYTYSLLVGLYTGGAVTLINPVIVNVLGLHKSATGLGVDFFFAGVGGLIGAPVLG